MTEDPRKLGPDRLRLRLGVGKTGDPENVKTPMVDPPEGPKQDVPARPRASTMTASPKEDSDPSGGRKKRKQKAGATVQGDLDVDEIVRRFYDIIQSAEDKDAVRRAVYAALYINATMSSAPLPPSSKNAEIEDIISEFEGDADLSSEIDDKLKQQGARRRRTKKSKKMAKKTRKYSRRR